MTEYAETMKNSGVTMVHLSKVLSEKTGRKVHPSYLQRCLSGKANTLAAQTLLILAGQYCEAIDEATAEFMRRK